MSKPSSVGYVFDATPLPLVLRRKPTIRRDDLRYRLGRRGVVANFHKSETGDRKPTDFLTQAVDYRFSSRFGRTFPTDFLPYCTDFLSSGSSELPKRKEQPKTEERRVKAGFCASIPN